jgi:hypothetical protein
MVALSHLVTSWWTTLLSFSHLALATFCRRECHFDQSSTKKDWIFVLSDSTTSPTIKPADSITISIRTNCCAKTMTKHQKYLLEAWKSGQDRIQFVTREKYTSTMIYYEELHCGDSEDEPCTSYTKATTRGTNQLKSPFALATTPVSSRGPPRPIS